MIGVMCDSKEMRECFPANTGTIQFDSRSTISIYSVNVYVGWPRSNRIAKIESLIYRNCLDTEFIDKIKSRIPIFRVRILT